MARASKPRIGVLALQGAFALHRAHIEALGAEYVEVVTSEDFEEIDALILPGGESGTLLKLIDSAGIECALSECLQTKPAWGICAGAILMARKIRNPSQRCFDAIDIEIERNAYGRQLESSEAAAQGYRVSYIRAPRIVSVGLAARVLGEREASPTWVVSGQRMVTTFHPELNRDTPSPWHRWLVGFLE